MGTTVGEEYTIQQIVQANISVPSGEKQNEIGLLLQCAHKDKFSVG